MGFNYDFGGEGFPNIPDWTDHNKWTDAVIPNSGSTIHFSGNSPQIIGPLTYNALHVLMSAQDIHVVSTADPTFSSSQAYQYYPADKPVYHIPESGATEYLSVVLHGLAPGQSSSVEGWVSPIERLTPAERSGSRF